MVTKASFSTILSLMQYVNASFTLLPTVAWGYKTKSGDMTGMVGHLIADEADITGTFFFNESVVNLICLLDR